MADYLEKVTIFITRNIQNRTELLLIEHPHAGIQIPAGTVEENETPETAAIREMQEETGIQEVNEIQPLGTKTSCLEDNQKIVCLTTPVYSRPKLTSSTWATLRRGFQVQLIKETASGFNQVKYEEFDQAISPKYVTLSIVGWVPENTLSNWIKRYFYITNLTISTPDTWKQQADYHSFKLFWTNINELPTIISPQNTWLEYLPIEIYNNV